MMSSKNQQEMVSAFAPASVANVGCGFDVLGFAINGPGDEVWASRAETPEVQIRAIYGDQGALPLDADKNTAGVAVRAMMWALDKQDEPGIHLKIYKKMPLGSGLGSSAASSVAAVVAVNRLFGDPFTKNELLPFATEGELVASGTAHADNAAASLFGGFVLIRSTNPLDVISLPAPEKLHCVVIHPHVEIRTEDTRKILRKQIPLAKAVTQWGNVGALVAGLMKSDYDLIARAMHDEIIEPIRSVLIPGYDSIKKAALQSGALGCSISGSGPSIFALVTSKEQAKETGRKMQAVLNDMALESSLYISKINLRGAEIVNKTDNA